MFTSVVETPWFTHVDGTVVTDAHEHPVVLARLAALTGDELEAVVGDALGMSVDELAEEVDLDVAFASQAEEDAAYRQAGLAQARANLLNAVKECEAAEKDFNGHRWFIHVGGVSSSGGLPPLYDAVNLVSAAGIADAPVDGDALTDAPALTATIAVVDTVADRVLAAVLAAARKSSDLAVVTEAASAAAAAARADVTALARQWRQVEALARAAHTDQVWQDATARRRRH